MLATESQRSLYNLIKMCCQIAREAWKYCAELAAWTARNYYMYHKLTVRHTLKSWIQFFRINFARGIQITDLFNYSWHLSARTNFYSNSRRNGERAELMVLYRFVGSLTDAAGKRWINVPSLGCCLYYAFIFTQAFGAISIHRYAHIHLELSGRRLRGISVAWQNCTAQASKKQSQSFVFVRYLCCLLVGKAVVENVMHSHRNWTISFPKWREALQCFSDAPMWQWKQRYSHLTRNVWKLSF